MSQVTVQSMVEAQDDFGFEANFVVSQNGVDSLEALGYLFAQAAQAMGYSYVASVQFTIDDGSVKDSEDYSGR